MLTATPGASLTSSAGFSIWRVVTCFVLWKDHEVAVFRRQATMPTFPGHWAGISGSIEAGETPIETARRELQEETNLSATDLQGGLHSDVLQEAKRRIIRVYPFVARLSTQHERDTLELRGTEHDEFRFITFQELESLKPTVPDLALTFHHATFGQHFHFSPEIRAWAFDRVTGASELTRRLLSTINPTVDDPKHVAMLRPTMVAIVNALKSLETSSPEEVATRLAHDTQATVSTGIQAIRDLIQQRQDPLSPLQVATLSRSSTIRDVLKPLLAENLVVVVVSQSTPGNEGEAMAAELGVEWKDDATLMDDISNYDLLLFGADCVMSNGYVVNKVGTQALAKAAKASGTQVWCCTDPWKRWQDEFPPPMEDIFELVSNQCIDRIVMGSSDRLL